MPITDSSFGDIIWPVSVLSVLWTLCLAWLPALSKSWSSCWVQSTGPPPEPSSIWWPDITVIWPLWLFPPAALQVCRITGASLGPDLFLQTAQSVYEGMLLIMWPRFTEPVNVWCLLWGAWSVAFAGDSLKNNSRVRFFLWTHKIIFSKRDLWWVSSIWVLSTKVHITIALIDLLLQHFNN